MAYLNVRDRRIEATIAYVGPELAGKSTFERIGEGERNGGTVTFGDDGIILEWRPTQRDRFDDCHLRVKLVAPESGLDTERFDDVLAQADGVVVVVEATAESRSETLRALHRVREAIERKDPGSPLPVVVQLNENEGADAAVADEVAQTIRWPVVRTSAMHGEGVMETLESALDNVVHALKQAPQGATASPLDKNPLLNALRDVLRETVNEHVASVERAITDRIADAVSTRFDALERVLEARHDQTIEAFTAASRRIDALEARLREDLSAQSRSDREHLTSVAAVLRRSVEAVAIELRNAALPDKQATLADKQAALVEKQTTFADKQAVLASEVTSLRAKTDAVSGTVDKAIAAIDALSPRIAAIESSVQREIRNHLERLLNALASSQTETGDTLQRTEKRTDEIKGHLDELIEELKRRKKGWFG